MIAAIAIKILIYSNLIYCISGGFTLCKVLTDFIWRLCTYIACCS